MMDMVSVLVICSLSFGQILFLPRRDLSTINSTLRMANISSIWKIYVAHKVTALFRERVKVSFRHQGPPSQDAAKTPAFNSGSPYHRRMSALEDKLVEQS